MPFLSAFHSRSLSNNDLTLAYTGSKYGAIDWTALTFPAGTGIPTPGSTTLVAYNSTNSNIQYMNTSGVWTSSSLPTPTVSTYPEGIIYGNNTFLIPGANGLCMWSSTNGGASWSVTNYTSGTTFGQTTYNASGDSWRVTGIFYCNGAWQMSVVGGSSGAYTHGLLTSSNGTSWSVAEAMSNVTQTLDSSVGNWAVNTAGTAALAASTSENYTTYYSTAVNTASQFNSSSDWTSPLLAGVGGCIGWVPDQNAFAVVNNGTNIGYIPVSQFTTGPGTNKTTGTINTGLSIAVLSNTGKSSVVVLSASAAGATTHPISFDGGSTWTTTTLPSVGSSDNMYFLSFNKQLYAWSDYADIAYVGTPA
jgi:hypothetical protein